MFKEYRDYLRLIRFEHSLMVAFTVLVGQAIVEKSVGLHQLLPALGPALITAGAFALNDVFGYASDKANKRVDRPLVAGKISRKNAWLAAIIFYALGLLSSTLVNHSAYTIALAFAVASLAYDAFLKKIPFAGNFFIASTMSASFLYASAAVTGSLSEFSFPILVFTAMAFVAGVARELLLTLRDVVGDRKAGMFTAPMLLGSRWTVMFSSVLFSFAIALSLLPLLQKFYWPYAIFIVAADALFVASSMRAFIDSSPQSLQKIRNYTLYALGLGLLAFATLAWV